MIGSEQHEVLKEGFFVSIQAFTMILLEVDAMYWTLRYVALCAVKVL
jgi:hypothetical protein